MSKRRQSLIPFSWGIKSFFVNRIGNVRRYTLESCYGGYISRIASFVRPKGTSCLGNCISGVCCSYFEYIFEKKNYC